MDINAFCQAHHDDLVRYALSLNISSDEAQDSVQDAWLSVIRSNSLKRIMTCPHAPARLRLCVKFAVIKRYRNERRQKRFKGTATLPLSDDIAIDLRTPDRLLELKWIREAMEREGVFEPGFNGPMTKAERVRLHRQRKLWRIALAEQACALTH